MLWKKKLVRHISNEAGRDEGEQQQQQQKEGKRQQNTTFKNFYHSVFNMKYYVYIQTGETDRNMDNIVDQLHHFLIPTSIFVLTYSLPYKPIIGF